MADPERRVRQLRLAAPDADAVRRLLPRLEDALRDGDRVYAVIRGAGINNDGRGEGPMTPRQEGQLAALVEPAVAGVVAGLSVGGEQGSGGRVGVVGGGSASGRGDLVGRHFSWSPC